MAIINAVRHNYYDRPKEKKKKQNEFITLIRSTLSEVVYCGTAMR